MATRTHGPKRLLIVEDKALVALELQADLEAKGYTVVGTASSADEALRLVSKQRVDLVLIDTRLPGQTDGVHAADILRREHDLPVIFLTANTDPRTNRRALSAHPGAYFAKPYNTQGLIATIELALSHHEARLARRESHAAEKAKWVRPNAELGDLAQHYRHEAITDPLTGLYNRRYFDAVLERELSRAQRESYPVGVIRLDLDRFKQLNDTYGQVAADAALQAVAELLRARLRASDVACRYAGEEIVVIVPGAQPRDAFLLAEQLRAGIERLAIEHTGQRLPQITASFGVSSFPSNGSASERLLEAADHALYVAKAEGRNRVSLAPPARP